MKKLAALLVLFSALVSLGCGQASDHQRLQGKWVAVSMRDDGHDEKTDDFFLEFTGDKVLVGKHGKPNEKGPGDFKLDETKQPKWLTVVEPNRQGPFLAIYEFRGEELCICVNQHVRSDDDRPTKFESERIVNGATSPNELLIVLRREKR